MAVLSVPRCGLPAATIEQMQKLSGKSGYHIDDLNKAKIICQILNITLGEYHRLRVILRRFRRRPSTIDTVAYPPWEETDETTPLPKYKGDTPRWVQLEWKQISDRIEDLLDEIRLFNNFLSDVLDPTHESARGYKMIPDRFDDTKEVPNVPRRVREKVLQSMLKAEHKSMGPKAQENTPAQEELEPQQARTNDTSVDADAEAADATPPPADNPPPPTPRVKKTRPAKKKNNNRQFFTWNLKSRAWAMR